MDNLRLIQDSYNQNQNLLSGGIAQLVERLPCTQEVSGSSPLTSTLTNYNQPQKEIEISTQTNFFKKEVGMLESKTLVRTLKTA
jgi:hypothetical protein